MTRLNRRGFLLLGAGAAGTFGARKLLGSGTGLEDVYRPELDFLSKEVVVCGECLFRIRYLFVNRTGRTLVCRRAHVIFEHERLAMTEMYHNTFDDYRGYGYAVAPRQFVELIFAPSHYYRNVGKHRGYLEVAWENS